MKLSWVCPASCLSLAEPASWADSGQLQFGSEPSEILNLRSLSTPEPVATKMQYEGHITLTENLCKYCFRNYITGDMYLYHNGNTISLITTFQNRKGITFLSYEIFHLNFPAVSEICILWTPACSWASLRNQSVVTTHDRYAKKNLSSQPFLFWVNVLSKQTRQCAWQYGHAQVFFIL